MSRLLGKSLDKWFENGGAALIRDVNISRWH